MTDQAAIRPAWLREKQLRWAWLAWEPLAMLRRHGGLFETIEANSHWVGDWFLRIHGEPYIRFLAESGFNCVTTHFHKGFGLVAEQEEMELTRRTIEVCHRYGIRVFTYIQSMSVMSETFFVDMPEAREWIQVDEQGRPQPYGEQYWRILPCLSNRHYVDYVKRVAEKAITWAQADGIWLDNTDFLPCACHACQAGFRTFLAESHPVVDRGRFGIDDLSQVRVPVKGRTYDPIYQEALRYRCNTIEAFVTEMRHCVRQLRADAVVATNYGVPGPVNAADVLGVNDSRALRAADISLIENGNFPEVRGEKMIHQILAHKMGRATGCVMVPSHWRIRDAKEVILELPEQAAHVKLTLAESAAFGGRCVGATWACRPIEAGKCTLIECADILSSVKNYNAFFAEYERLFTAAQSAARVATYRNFASQAFMHDAFTQAVLGVEESLIHHHVPFKVLFEEDLQSLVADRHVDVLILSNVMCMSDREIKAIRAFTEAGGMLLATGETSLYDENRRQRRDYGLADIFGVSFADMAATKTYRTKRGVFIPRASESVSYNHLNYQLRPELPKCHAELIEHIRTLEGSAIMFSLEQGAFIAAEVTSVLKDTLIHLVNYKNRTPRSGVRLVFEAGEKLPSTVQCLSPDENANPTVLDVVRGGDGRQVIEVPNLDTYVLLLLRGEE